MVEADKISSEESTTAVKNEMRIEQHFSELVSRDGEISRLCESALSHWNDIFDRTLFLDNLKRYSELISLQSHDESQQLELRGLLRFFKTVRKASMYLRTMYLFFDVAHEEPERLHTFVWQLGQFNDTFMYPDKSDAHARILNIQLEPDVSWGEFSIIPDTPDRAMGMAAQPLERALTLLESPQLAAEEFHQLRKKLRLFANVYTVASRGMADEATRHLKDLLVGINEELGAINDEMVSASIRGERRYEEHVVSLPEGLKTAIRALLNP